jgi:hypothetical protein
MKGCCSPGVGDVCSDSPASASLLPINAFKMFMIIYFGPPYPVCYRPSLKIMHHLGARHSRCLDGQVFSTVLLARDLSRMASIPQQMTHRVILAGEGARRAGKNLARHVPTRSFSIFEYA